MNIILLSGGSGKRLWPLSNEVRSKQFLKIFRREDGTRESMVQHMYRKICEVDSNAIVTIATSNSQLASIANQLGENVGISVEPCRRDTFPAILLATAYLHDIKGISYDAPVIVCPVDPYVDDDYYEMLSNLSDQITKCEANLVLMGIEPTSPSEKYGYIIPETKDDVSRVKSFKEKPDRQNAEKYISQGALWNGGVFAYKIGYVLEKAKEYFGFSDYNTILSNYDSLTKISFDYAIVEKETSIQVVRFSGKWQDLGTWSSITDAMSEETSGNVVMKDCLNTHVINELQIPLVAYGVENVAIVATPDGILVTDKDASDGLKDCIVEQRPMYEKRIWGEYKVLDYTIQTDGNNSLTKHLILWPNKHISYQTHKHRAEMWTFTEGTGKLILDDKVINVSRGDTAYIKPGMKHAIKADTELHIIEVQIGDELIEEDIERLDWDWDNVD